MSIYLASCARPIVLQSPGIASGNTSTSARCCAVAAPSCRGGGVGDLKDKWYTAAASVLIASSLICQPAWAGQGQVAQHDPLADQSKILSMAKNAAVSNQLRALEQDTGFQVRIFTKVAYTRADLDAARREWRVNNRTVLLVFDPTSPNIFGYDWIGDDILLGPLRRPFWIELQARFGNMFYVRDNGEGRALESVVTAVDSCLRAGGCVRVPGLPEEQYYFTLILSILGGIIFGFSFRLEPNEVISKKWIWPVLLSPLWASLFVSFGLGPIISRTNDLQPVVQNTAAFLVAALLIRPNPRFFKENEESS